MAMVRNLLPRLISADEVTDTSFTMRSPAGWSRNDDAGQERSTPQCCLGRFLAFKRPPSAAASSLFGGTTCRPPRTS
eukprot:scaffold1399_cov410-Prasinococcus_capsulatus_cf.AAC.27